MKIYKILIATLVASLLFSSCDKDFLTTSPTASITSDRVKELGNEDPVALKNVLNSQITGLYSWLIQFNSGGGERHNDFGITSFGLRTDLMNDDMVQYTNNYGWYYSDYDFSVRELIDVYDAYIPWNYFYKLIKFSNDIILSISEDVKDKELIAMRGQAYGMRAFAYLYLVQLYSHTYIGHENDMAVPIVTEKTSDADKANNPRATVTAVYELIVSDFKKSISDLDGYARKSKVELNQQIVKGLLARTYLNMGNPEAATLAREARQGFKLMQGSEYATVGFKDISETEWMWGCDVTDQSAIAKTGIVNLPSHLSSLSYGYATAGNMQKCIDAKLYSSIPATDLRKAAWIDPEETAGNGFKKVVAEGNEMLVPAYGNVKFGRYNKGSDNFNDYVLMRTAEMYLIEAEALAKTDAATAQQVLYDFEITRNPRYIKSTKTGDELVDEIYQQRRIELWGEGFSYFDHKRLKKPIVRNYDGTNHNEDARLNYPAEDKVYRFRIPKRELQYNIGIKETDNND